MNSLSTRIQLSRIGHILAAGLLAFVAVIGHVQAAERIKEIATISGQRGNQLVGYGLVVGLDGSGDQSTQSPFTLQSTLSMLQSLGVSIPPGRSIQTRNTAAVMVTAELPALARPGQRLDLTVASIGNAKSIRGGTLLMTPLRAADGQIYALAQGNIFVGGAGASAAGSSTQINHLAAGRIPAGGVIERSPPAQQIGEFVQLDLNESNYDLMNRTAQAIVQRFGPGVAMPQDARSLRVAVPGEPMARIAFMAELENLQVGSGIAKAKVVINSRTGSVVMNQAVLLTPSAVAHGNLTVRIQAETGVSQPNPFGAGQTVAAERAQIDIDQGGQGGGLISVPSGASLDEVVRALNILGTKPADLMAILQALKAAGALRAELEVI